jgi:hypothetical protein
MHGCGVVSLARVSTCLVCGVLSTRLALITDLCFACSGAYDCGCFAKHNILA